MAIATAATLCALVACGNSSTPTDSPPATTPGSVTGAAKALAPFEPCSDIDDATLRRAGLNPAAREAVPSPNPQVTAACRFNSDGFADVVVSNSTETFEQFRDKNEGNRIGLDIGTRPTVIVRLPDPDGPCSLAMKTKSGIVLVETKLVLNAKEWGMDRCGGIREIGEAIEPAIGPR